VVGVQKLLRRTLGETIELTVDTHCGPASVNVDPGQFEQVLMNLAMRARDAMKSGGALAITTRADCEAGPGMAPGRFVAVEVSDTGATLENIERAFEPYFASSDKSEASGLELATVYAIVKQAGGDVRVTSEAGRGTRFTIVLPTCTAAEDPAPALPKSKGLEGTETLILVEDEPLVRRITAAELRARGYTVLEAVDGEDALRQARSHAGRLECVVTDLVMPRLGGEDLVRQLRPQRPGIRVLFVSGYSIESQPFAATSDPDVAFLGKPFGPAELSRALRELLDRAPRA
jgi:CheY-like chemotaxis protein